MHLHGTYFSVDADADEGEVAPATGPDPPRVVTNLMRSGHTVAMTWTPAEPGHWLFHCHILGHVDPLMRLTKPPAGTDHADHGAADGERHMAGLVLDINVLPAASAPAATSGPTHPRPLTLEVGERGGVPFPAPFPFSDKPDEKWPALGYRLTDGAAGPTTAPFSSPGPTIVLTRGEPVAISVVNHLSKSTTVHWHGIELQSYYDGVSGIGGDDTRKTPAIQPGSTFVAKFTPPRAGTFMYHTHLNDYEQLTTGLYGVVVVLEPGARFNPDLDRVFVLSRGPNDDGDPALINGREWPEEQALQRGVTYRLRFAGITALPAVRVMLRTGDTVLAWTPLAKDGAAFSSPHKQASAEQLVQPGETFDFEFTPKVEGPIRLVAMVGRLHTEMTLRVR
jgi:FtsP/CotA-like multicopper oxidase with cupredoxin domain